MQALAEGDLDGLIVQDPYRMGYLGVWTMVQYLEGYNVAPDGKKEQLFGPNPKGILVLDASGQYAQIIVNPDSPKFKANNRLKGTPEENAAAVHGTTATFGTWTVDEASNQTTD